MSATMEVMPPNGHGSFLTRTLNKLKLIFTRAEVISYQDLTNLTPAEQAEDIIRFCNDYQTDETVIFFDPNTGYTNLVLGVYFNAGTGYTMF